MEGLERRCRSGVDLLVKASGERGNWPYVVQVQDRKGAFGDREGSDPISKNKMETAQTKESEMEEGKLGRWIWG